MSETAKEEATEEAPPPAAGEGMVTLSAEQAASLEQEMAELRAMKEQLEADKLDDPTEEKIPTIDTRVMEGFGKYIVPAENTLSSHYHLVLNRENKLDFWPEQSPAFDCIISQTFLTPALDHPNHPDYFNYEPLRDNIATVRNYLLQATLQDVDPGNPAAMMSAMQKVEEMGREIGVALQRDTITRRPGSLHLDVEEASVPGAGAAKIYELLERKQNRHPLLRPLDMLLGMDYRQWGLPSIEETPFSQENVENFCLDLPEPSAPPPPQAELTAPAQTAPAPTSEVVPAQAPTPPPTTGQQVAMLGASILGSARALGKVEKLPRPVKNEAIDIARDILDKLRIGTNNCTVESWLSLPEKEALACTQAIGELTSLYAQTHETATASSPELAGSPLLTGADTAMGKLAYLSKVQAIRLLEGEGMADDAAALRSEIEGYPPEWKQVDGDTIGNLLGQVKSGIEITHAAGHNIPRLSHETRNQQEKNAAAMLGELLKMGVSPDELQELKNLGATCGKLTPEEAQRQHRATVHCQKQPSSPGALSHAEQVQESRAGDHHHPAAMKR